MRDFKNAVFGILIIFFVYFLSLFVLKFFHINFSVAVFGIFILFICLKVGILPKEPVKCASNFILKYMMLFFIPLLVGIVNYYSLIEKNLFAILAIVFLTTFLTIIITGLFFENVLKFTRLNKIKKISSNMCKTGEMGEAK